VRRLRSFAACLLLALWLPAMLHCDLEAANVHIAHNAQHSDAAPGGCADNEPESCHPIESGAYTAAAPSLKVPPPSDSLHALIAALACLCHECNATALSTSPDRHSPPPELRVGWHFITRAAPPARAPSAQA
jgi:hypothetical protein